MDIGATPWAATTPAMPRGATALTITQRDLAGSSAEAGHLASLAHLARTVRVSADELTRSEGSAPDAQRATALASTLAATANALGGAITFGETARVAQGIRAQLGLARHIEIDPAWPGAPAARRALSEVVSSAARLTGRSGA